MSVCVVMCRQVVYVLVGSKKLFFCVGMCRHVSAGCLCVGRFKKNCIVKCVEAKSNSLFPVKSIPYL